MFVHNFPLSSFCLAVIKGTIIPDLNKDNAKEGVELMGSVIMPVSCCLEGL